MYYKQLPCIYHPDLNITNFCQDQDCLMPLCPSCIREHTEYHQQVKTKPSYFNIYEALAETDTLITSSICNLEKDKKRNSQLIFRINRLPAIVHDKIQQAKTMAIKIVEQSFSQLEKDALQRINKINEDMNLHSLRKSQNHQESICNNLHDLYDLVDGLKTESCLSDMIFYLKEKRFEVEDLHTEMSRYLYVSFLLDKDNQNHDPYIQISKEAQQSLAVVVHRMFRLDPKDRQQQSFVMGKNLGGEKSSVYENSYHISLTPSKVKKPLYSLQKERTTNPQPRQRHHPGTSPTSRPKNTSYQYAMYHHCRNYNEYQNLIQKSRQTSRQKGTSFRGDDGSLRQISIKEKERKQYYQDINNGDVKQRGLEMTKRLNSGRYGNGNVNVNNRF